MYAGKPKKKENLELSLCKFCFIYLWSLKYLSSVDFITMGLDDIFTQKLHAVIEEAMGDPWKFELACSTTASLWK